MSERVLSECAHKFNGTNCKICGVYNHPTDPVLKTTNFDSYLNCSASKYIKHMRKRQSQKVQLKQINESTYVLLQSICEKFEYSIQTLALGIYIYAKTCQKQDRDEKFWASAALIVASKGIQLDKRVPYLNRYQRYADKTYSQDDYEIAERTIFEEMSFDIQYSTFISFIHFYLTNGFIFKSDIFHPASLKFVEDDVLTRAKDYMKTGQFLHYQPQILALSIIKEIRTKFRLTPWTKQLELISGYNQEQIPSLQKNNILKPLNSLYQKNKDKLNHGSINSSMIHNLQSSLNLTQQKIRSNKKGLCLDHTLKIQSLKQNSGKIFQQAPLTSLRNNVLSSNKYTNNFLTVTSEKIIPLNSFVSSRRV